MLQPQPDAEKRVTNDVIIAHLEELRSNRPTILLATGKTAKAGETIRKIIAAARQVFIEVGHAGLTQRDVAEAAGIAVGNLTYHFPTKRALLDAMLQEVLADYLDDHIRQYQASPNQPLQILLNVVESYVRNARHAHRFFYHMWGYAGCDEDVKHKIRSYYQAVGRFIYYLVRAANPKLNDTQIRRATLQLSSVEEGIKLFIGMGPGDDSSIAAAEEDIRQLTEKIVMTAHL
ncbi:MAG: TetR/AcrR family transcriptional regulator [Alphaproteobacteria bacterium]|nr:TetR/AcrR family transcriptional regulator [Alphaproteobacteria bacterium]